MRVVITICTLYLGAVILAGGNMRLRWHPKDNAGLDRRQGYELEHLKSFLVVISTSTSWYSICLLLFFFF